MATGIRRDQWRGLEQRPISTNDIVDGTIVAGDLNPAVYGGTPTSIDPDDAGAAGVASTLSRSDHQHQATAAVAVSVGTANAEGAAATWSRSDHVHDIGAGAIDDATMIADGTITAAKTNHEAWTSAAVTFVNVVLGTGGTATMHYIQVGRTVHFRAGFTLGTGTGNVNNPISVNLPVNAAAGRRQVGPATAIESGVGVAYPGIAIIDTSTMSFWDITQWSTTHPFDWNAGDELLVTGIYEAAT